MAVRHRVGEAQHSPRERGVRTAGAPARARGDALHLPFEEPEGFSHQRVAKLDDPHNKLGTRGWMAATTGQPTRGADPEAAAAAHAAGVRRG
jgi:hypothetical protein